MSDRTPQFRLPERLDHYLSLLERRFSQKGEHLLREIVVHGVGSVVAGAEYDNWDGGTHAHAVTLSLPNQLFLQVVDGRNEIEWQLRDELQKVAPAPNEMFGQITLEPLLEYEADWRERTGIYKPSSVRSVASDVSRRIWGDHRVRVFLSHRDSIKADAHKLKERLKDFGIGAFVAHESIEASLDWQQEIQEALRSMDVLVALITEDFSDSNWTDQEVGFALGRSTPVITVALGRDPYGFMGRHQAIRRVRLSDPAAMAMSIFTLLKERVLGEQRLLDAAIDAFAASTDFKDSEWKVNELLPLFSSVEQTQIDRILRAFVDNSQNQGAFATQRRLPRLLKQWTGKDWRFNGSEVLSVVTDDDYQFPPEEEGLPF